MSTDKPTSASSPLLMSASAPPPAPAPQGSDWESIWKTLQPGEFFDALSSAPILSTLPDSPHLPSTPGLRALVPGCGRGYDVHLLGSHPRFAHATGLEISPTAVQAARDYLAAASPPLAPERYAIVDGDFFDASVAPGPFDVAFDYTFFCAIPPQRRQQWAHAYAARMRPGAVLATLMFPFGKPLEAGGPPFGVTEEHYRNVLGAAGFECVQAPRVLANDEATEGRGDGRSMWALWRRVEQA